MWYLNGETDGIIWVKSYRNHEVKAVGVVISDCTELDSILSLTSPLDLIPNALRVDSVK